MLILLCQQEKLSIDIHYKHVLQEQEVTPRSAEACSLSIVPDCPRHMCPPAMSYSTYNNPLIIKV